MMSSIEILKGELYVIGTGSFEPSRELFKKLNEIDRIEFLIKKTPSSLKLKNTKTQEIFYSPSIGKFIISNNNSILLRFKDSEKAQRTAERYFLKLEETCKNINECYHTLEKAIYSGKDYKF